MASQRQPDGNGTGRAEGFALHGNPSGTCSVVRTSGGRHPPTHYPFTSSQLSTPIIRPPVRTCCLPTIIFASQTHINLHDTLHTRSCFPASYVFIPYTSVGFHPTSVELFSLGVLFISLAVVLLSCRKCKRRTEDKRGVPFAPCQWRAPVLRVSCQRQIDKSQVRHPPRSLTYGSARCIIAANGLTMNHSRQMIVVVSTPSGRDHLRACINRIHVIGLRAGCL